MAKTTNKTDTSKLEIVPLKSELLSITSIASAIPQCRIQDQHGFKTRLNKINAEKETTNIAKQLDILATLITKSLTTVQQKKASLPEITYSDSLPINQRRDEIAQLINDNQVVVIAGETGSGKTTQIPKICLSLGLGNKGLIGHTQPRRIAARTVGKRIADELKTTFGDVIGYQVRFAEQLSENTRVKLMTDGVLLAEFQQDPFLSKYEVIIIDEAHERSLNIDFLLGLLKRLLKKRRDLKLIITSATIDLEKFANHFGHSAVLKNAHSNGSLSNNSKEINPNTHSNKTTSKKTISKNLSSASVNSDTNDLEVNDLEVNNSDVDNSINTSNNTPAPIIEVSGRTYPVDVLYHPLPEGNFVDLSDAIADSVTHIIDGEVRGEFNANGDILVFCAGEREIREAAKTLRDRQLPVNILPLYSRLSIAEQNKVFKPAPQRKVVLATNVAETSITVPGIAYVIDPGVARISRYSYRSKIQRLQIEPISQASANQRMGRCGRVSNGVCIRLYSEENFQARPEFTDAELLRSNLAAVILQLLQLRIHTVENFPFIDKPDKRLLNDGFKLLYELQAIDKQQRLSKLGRTLTRIPLDPKYARMLYTANSLGCLSEVIIIVAALSIQDPREFPADKLQAAREKHRLLQNPTSDFISYLTLWFSIEKQRQASTKKQFKEYCQKNFLSVVRYFEWRDMARQLKQTVSRLNWSLNSISDTQKIDWLAKSILKTKDNNDIKNAKNIKHSKQANKPFNSLSDHIPDKTSNHSQERKGNDIIHRALLSGLLSNIAIHDENNDYLATRGRKLSLFPASALVKKTNKNRKQNQNKATKQSPKNAKWIMANELIETSRLFAHTAAEIAPHWVQKTGEHLLHYQYASPSYHERAGAVKALRSASIYGLMLRDKTAVIYSDIAPEECHQLFIQQSLVEGAYARHPSYKPNEKSGQNFYAHNSHLIAEIEDIEAKQRKRNLLIAETEIYHLYAERIPKHIVNWIEFEQWRKTAEKKQSDLLKFKPEQLRLDSSNASANTKNSLNQAEFPTTLVVDGKSLPLSYHFNPKDPDDGVTLTLPISLLELFPNYIGDWLVPGLLREKCIALIKTLPKVIRKRYAPAAHAVDRVISDMPVENKALHNVLGEKLKRAFGETIPDDAWNLEALDDYYKLNFHLVDSDEAQTSIQQSRDLVKLKQIYSEYVADSLKVENAPERSKYEIHGITEWNFGELAKKVEYSHQGMTVRAYPMLKVQINEDEKQTDTISLLLHQSPLFAEYFTHNSLIVLAKKPLKQSITYLKKELFKDNTTSLTLLPIAPNKAAQNILITEIINSAIRYCCFPKNIPKDQDEFMRQINEGRNSLIEYALELENSLLSHAKRLGEINRKISDLGELTIQTDEIVEDIKTQLYELFENGFLNRTTLQQLKQYSRYLKSIEQRLDQLHAKKMRLPDILTRHQSDVDKAISACIKQVEHEEPSINRQTALKFLLWSQSDLNEHLIMLKEWRVSLFTQHLKTQYPVSEKRILEHWAAFLINNNF